MKITRKITEENLNLKMEAEKVCFNAECGATSSEKWRNGWILRSGQFADLCDTCGSAFEQMRFCEIFHPESDGWRKCKTCQKPVHCGCISSVNLFMHLDAGGIECILCARKSDNHLSEHFPAISQPEGVPLKIQDANGQEWVLQFRYLPYNNSRMYGLGGVTPCMQSMQSQAGDTDNISQHEPEGKIIMGFRKALNSNIQEGKPSKIGKRASPSNSCDPGATAHMLDDAYPSRIPLHPRKRKKDPSKLISQFQGSETDFRWYRNGKVGEKSSQCNFLQTIGDKMQHRNLGSKNKRLQIDNEDSLDLKITWEEAQGLFCPPLSAVPSVVIIEGHEFEEFEEPPIFRKRTVFCTEHARAPSSTACEMSFKDVENIFQESIGSKKKRGVQRQKDLGSSSGLNACTPFGSKTTSSSLVSPTRKHPRHRLGCTCIVCIQPPSGKGPKHKPSCTCNVCTTVKRRFKTLMMRHRKRQSEKGAEKMRKTHNSLKEETSTSDHEEKRSDMHSQLEEELMQEIPVSRFKKGLTKNHDYPGNEIKLSSDFNLHSSCNEDKGMVKDNAVPKGVLDLNSQPVREEDLFEIEEERGSRFLNNATLPLDMYVEQHELPNLIYPPQIGNTLGFQQRSRVDKSSGVENEDFFMKEECNPNRSTNDVRSLSI